MKTSSAWKEYPKYKNLINYIAFHNSNSNDYQENKDQAVLFYVEAANKFDEGKNTSFKSFIGKTVRNELIDYNRKKRSEIFFQDMKKEEEDNPEEWIVSNLASPEHNLSFKEKLEGLSEEAKEVIKIVLESPREIWEFMDTMWGKEYDRTNLLEYLKYEYGWGINKIWKIFNEIKSILK